MIPASEAVRRTRTAAYVIAVLVLLFPLMFAIAVWDSRERRLSLIRDRLGIKPVYYYHKDGVFAFASELKAMRASDESRLQDIFRAVFELQPSRDVTAVRQISEKSWDSLAHGTTCITWGKPGMSIT